jgi:hypothetical protein
VRAARAPSLDEAWRRLEEWGHARGWAGTDPYDGLNATRLAWPLTASVLGKRVLTQVVKRSPLDLRPLFGIPAGRSPGALAHVVSAYAGTEMLESPVRESRLREAVAMLEGLRAPGYEEACWGYHFDVQTRVFFYPQGSPNTIATAFSGMSLLDAFESTGDERLLRLAESAGDFFLRHVPQTHGEGGAFFGYLAGDRTPIHNASMLVCALLARLAAQLGRDDMSEAARAGVSYTLAHQAAEGSWPYGEEPHLGWIDNFHTGYVLESLMTCADAGIDVDGGEGLRRGLEFWRERMFDPDGAPRYYPASRYPVDSQCVAQAIQTAALAERHFPGSAELGWRVFGFALREMRGHDGSFAFQIDRRWRNTTPHVRWTQAPMLLALTRLEGAARG